MACEYPYSGTQVFRDSTGRAIQPGDNITSGLYGGRVECIVPGYADWAGCWVHPKIVINEGVPRRLRISFPAWVVGFQKIALVASG